MNQFDLEAIDRIIGVDGEAPTINGAGHITSLAHNQVAAARIAHRLARTAYTVRWYGLRLVIVS